jgi:hypothetical protein
MKLNKDKILKQLKSIGILSALSILTAIFITIFFISIPFTENYIAQYTYNLSLKSQLYSYERFKIELEDKGQSDNYISIVKSRLTQAEIERFNIEKKDDESIEVMTWSTKDQYMIQSLLSTDGSVTIMTLKEGIDLNDENNIIAAYIEDSYDKTDINRDYFRRIIVRQSPTSQGGLAYFLVFKPTIDKQDEIEAFITNNQGKQIGINIFGYVTPYQVNGPDLVVGVGSDEKDKLLSSAIFNTKPIGTKITTTSEETQSNVQPYGFFEFINNNYSNLTAVFALLTVLAAIILGVLNKNKYRVSLIMLFSTILTLSIWLAYLKITNSAIDLFTIIVCGVVIIINNFASSLIKSIDARVIKLLAIIAITILAPLLVPLFITGVGFVDIIANKLIWVILLSEVILELFKLYLQNLTIYLNARKD